MRKTDYFCDNCLKEVAGDDDLTQLEFLIDVRCCDYDYKNQKLGDITRIKTLDVCKHCLKKLKNHWTIFIQSI